MYSYLGLKIHVFLLKVQDYRNVASQQGSITPCLDGSPIINKVRLKMSLENVVKDIPMSSDISWTYGDLMVHTDNCLSFANYFFFAFCLAVKHLIPFDFRKQSLEY